MVLRHIAVVLAPISRKLAHSVHRPITCIYLLSRPNYYYVEHLSLCHHLVYMGAIYPEKIELT